MILVDLDLFYGKVQFCTLHFYVGKCDIMMFSFEIIASCDLEFG